MKFKKNLRDWLKGPIVKDSNDVSQEAIGATDVPGSSTLSLSHDVAPPFISNIQETTTDPRSSLQSLDSIPKYGLGVLCGPPEPLEKAKNAEEKKQRRKDARRDGQETDHNQDKPRRPIVDIVFVHGLTGSTQSTWLDTNGTYWPIHLLGQDVRDARILAFGYDADVVHFWNPASQNRISNHAENLLGALSRLRENTKAQRRPILFIAHSLGGLVVENALRISRLSAETHIQMIEPCVNSVIFLGSPHFGADIASWAKLGTNLVQIMKKANKEIVSVLQPGSEMLAEVQRGFHNIMRLRAEEGSGIAITCFYEELPLPIVGEVVPKHSAIIPGYSAYGIHANHMDMTKFGMPNDAGYQAILGELNIHLRRIRHAKQTFSSKDANCLQSFYKSDYRAQREMSNLRTPGTCDWLLRHAQYQSWIAASDPTMLWISGDPGSGKSVLASYLVTQLENPDSQAILQCQICYFFFKDDNANQCDATLALCAIIHQILDRNHELIQFAHVEREKKGSRLTQEFHALWDLLLIITDSNQGTDIVIIFDALDECSEPTRGRLINALAKMYSSSLANSPRSGIPRIIVTSRPYRSIELGFRQLASARLKVEHETAAVDKDIELMIEAKVGDIACSMHLDRSRETAFKDALITRSDRTFLWVSLVLKIIEQSVGGTEEEFQQAIVTLPADLDAAYEKILNKTPTPDKAKRILQIVVSAVRPLTLEEINIAQGIRPGMRSSTDLKRYLLPDVGNSVKHLCGLFLRNIDSKIYLVHQTAREFLIRQSNTAPQGSLNWKHSLEWSEANSVMSEICVSYLLFDVFEDRPLGWDAHQDSNAKAQTSMSDQILAAKYCEEHNFFAYAAGYWTEHVRNAKITQSSKVVDSSLSLCDPRSQLFQSWIRTSTCHEPDLWHFFSSQKQDLTAIMVASFFGHDFSVKTLLEEKLLLDFSTATGDTALHMAALNGHKTVAESLLQADAKIDAQNLEGFTPLYIAINRGHRSTIQLFLTFGAKLQSRTNISDTALHLAARQGHDDVVHTLLNLDAEYDVKNYYKETALHLASRRDYERVVRLLLRKGADPNIRNDSLETALHLASRRGSASIVQLLWKHNVSMNEINEYGETALHIVARSGNEELVRLLLLFKVDPQIKDQLGQTALHLASQSRSSVAVQLLLEKGSETEASFRNGWTALHLAVFWGQQKTVQLLLSAPCDLDHRNSNGYTALHLGVVEGLYDIVRLLWESGAVVDEEDISLAEEKGYVQIAKLLGKTRVGGKSSTPDSPVSPMVITSASWGL